MPNLQQPYEHVPVERVLVMPDPIGQPIEEAPSIVLHADTIGELITTLQRLVTENPSIANTGWYGYDDMCLHFVGYCIEPDLS